MTRFAPAAGACMCIVVAPGCSSDGPARAAPTSFEPDPPASEAGPIVFLRGTSSSTASVLVDVVARGLDRDIHGAAFRIHWDATKLDFDGASGSSAWSPQALFLSKEALPGELVVA